MECLSEVRSRNDLNGALWNMAAISRGGGTIETAGTGCGSRDGRFRDNGVFYLSNWERFNPMAKRPSVAKTLEEISAALPHI
jgi:hypothetical protein